MYAREADERIGFVVSIIDPLTYDIDLGERIGTPYHYEDVLVREGEGENASLCIGYSRRCSLQGIELLPHVDTSEAYYEILRLIDLSEGWVFIDTFEESDGGKVYVTLRECHSQNNLATIMRDRFPHLLRCRSTPV